MMKHALLTLCVVFSSHTADSSQLTQATQPPPIDPKVDDLKKLVARQEGLQSSTYTLAPIKASSWEQRRAKKAKANRGVNQ